VLRLVRLLIFYGMFLPIAHAALLMNVSMSAGSSELAMSISEVHIVIDGCAYLWQSL
jgi:hypothetical protein